VVAITSFFPSSYRLTESCQESAKSGDFIFGLLSEA
jgi:hypothetical protein